MNIIEIKNLISIWMGSSRLHNWYPEILPTQTDMNTSLLPSAASPVFILPLSASATTTTTVTMDSTIHGITSKCQSYLFLRHYYLLKRYKILSFETKAVAVLAFLFSTWRRIMQNFTPWFLLVFSKVKDSASAVPSLMSTSYRCFPLPPAHVSPPISEDRVRVRFRDGIGDSSDMLFFFKWPSPSIHWPSLKYKIKVLRTWMLYLPSMKSFTLSLWLAGVHMAVFGGIYSTSFPGECIWVLNSWGRSISLFSISKPKVGIWLKEKCASIHSIQPREGRNTLSPLLSLLGSSKVTLKIILKS